MSFAINLIPKNWKTRHIYRTSHRSCGTESSRRCKSTSLAAAFRGLSEHRSLECFQAFSEFSKDLAPQGFQHSHRHQAYLQSTLVLNRTFAIQ